MMFLSISFSATAETAQDGMRAFESGDYERSAILLRQEADSGNPDSATLYALQLIQGLGIERDRAQAQIYFIKGASFGSKEAQYLYFFYFGLGSDDLSLQMLRDAAAQGHVAALSDLGAMYLDGRNVPQDFREALSVLERASRTPNPLFIHGGEVDDRSRAQLSLSSMHFQGKGTPVNLIIAHMWANVAAANGMGYGRIMTQKMEEMMPTEDTITAQNMARICMETNYETCGNGQ